MHTLATIATACLILGTGLPAQAQPNQPDLSALPEVVKNLQWKTIDSATLSPLEYCRVLAFMNDALDDIGASARAEADLMSTFIEQNNLGPQFAASPPPANPSPLTYDDGVKISVAMLRGPLAQSSYAKDYEGTTDQSFLAATIGLFDSSSRRKWDEVVESRTQVRWMAQYLQETHQAAAYKAWVPSEVRRREQEYQDQLAKQKAAAAEKRQTQQQKAADLQAQREKQAEEEREAQRVEAQKLAASQQMQQAMGAAQQSQGSQAIISPDDSDDVILYPAYRYGAATYLGTSAWYRDGAYRGAAGTAVDNRMSGWNRAARRRR